MNTNLSNSPSMEPATRLERLLALLRVDPGNARLRSQCIELAHSCGRFDTAIELADAALAADPSDAAALFAKSNGLIGRREYRAALEVLREVARIAGLIPEVRTNLALCHYCLGEFADAQAHLEECYRAGARTPGVLRLLVSSHHHQGAMQAAVEIALENQDGVEDAGLAGAYAILFLDADDMARAAQWSKKALSLDPRSIEGRLTEATLLTARMQTDRAKQMFEDVVNDAPASGRAWIGLGTLALLDQQFDAAKRLLTRGLQDMPGHVGSWHALAWTQMLSGELDAADGSFQKALELDRNFSETHGGLASIAALRGDEERARHEMTVALKLDPQCLSARFAQSVLADRTGAAVDAQKIIREAVIGITSRDSSALSQFLLKSLKR
jgi:tetratricopeptide (TPR) repeat protein